MAKIKLTSAPTFKAKVAIPVPGSKSADVEFTFKGRTKQAFKDFIDGIAGKEDLEVVLDCVTGWDLEDAFGPDTMTQLIENYIGAARVIIETYINQLTAARQGN